jgi:hypothetical protein
MIFRRRSTSGATTRKPGTTPASTCSNWAGSTKPWRISTTPWRFGLTRAIRLNAEGTVCEIGRLVREDAARDPQAVLINCNKHLRINDRDPIAHARRCLTLALLGRDANAAEEMESFRAMAPDLAGTLTQVLKAVAAM